jgi:hypothetical protein
MIFKIYGERNSGTNFLTLLLKTNFGDRYVFEDHLDLNTSICYYWKHGYPDQDLNKVDEEVVTIFIIRDLTKWLVSMYHNPFCLDFNNKTRSFDYFIQQKHEYELSNDQVIKKQSISKCLLKWMYTFLFNNTSTEKIINPNIKILLNQRIRHHRLRNIRPTEYIRDHRKLLPLNYCDHNLTIFEIRYGKIFEYIKFSNFNNCIFLMLDDLQNNEYCRSFLYRISDQFNLPLVKISLLNRNLKTCSKEKNTKYSTNPYLYSSLISKYENVDLENCIKHLNFLKHV